MADPTPKSDAEDAATKDGESDVSEMRDEPTRPDSASVERAASDLDVTSAATQEAIALSGIADGVRTRETYSVSLEAFEGPLDLMLHLVRRHELDVLDIPISFVARKYIEYIEFARALDIEIAGEYLVMAATLAFLKSRELLPQTAEELAEEAEEEGVDPRQELIQRLLEYERYRHAGGELASRPLDGRDLFPRGAQLRIEPLAPDLAPITLFRLADAFQRVLERARVRQSHDVEIEPVTVRVRMHQLSMLLIERRTLDFEGLFLAQTWGSERELRQMLVVTLMSVLELVKLGVMAVHQPDGSETLLLERVAEAEEIGEVIQGYDEEASFGEPGIAPSPPAPPPAPAQPEPAEPELAAPELAAPEPEPEQSPNSEPMDSVSPPAEDPNDGEST